MIMDGCDDDKHAQDGGGPGLQARDGYLAAEEPGWGCLCSGHWSVGPSAAGRRQHPSPPDDPVTYPKSSPEPVLPEYDQTLL